jgi:pimeloyl-ACP methyl ester carboxylesterase
MKRVTSQTTLHGNPHCVFLLHGLCRTSRSMGKLHKALVRAGYDVVNVNYPSRHFPLARLARDILDHIRVHTHQKHYACIHFVTHSMGGIIVRHMLATHTFSNLGRVVMLSPPNQGSEVVDRLRHLSLYQWLNGPAGLELGTSPNNPPSLLGPAHFDLGIIAGRKTINFLLSTMIPGENDGKVSIQRAQLAGMQDFLVVNATHSFIMKNSKVIDHVLSYLKKGRFRHPGCWSR